jgi:transketolase
MRAAFISTLCDLAERDDRIVLMVADLGFGVVEPFAKRFPDRFINAGVAEQNLTGVAAGIALCGKIVFAYSIGNFPTLRCLEQIRADVCYHNANVKIVSVGAGLAYGALGASHHATEDVAVMRALPNMTVVSPADALETQCATCALTAVPGPAYLRLGRSAESFVHQEKIAFRLGKAIQVMDGSDVTLIATGAMVHVAVTAGQMLAQRNIRARVLSMHTIKPLDESAILAAAQETGAVITVEEHSIIGGLGSAVAEVLAEGSLHPLPFTRIALPSQFVSLVGSQSYLQQAYSLSPESVVSAALRVRERARLIQRNTHSVDETLVFRGSL